LNLNNLIETLDRDEIHFDHESTDKYLYILYNELDDNEDQIFINKKTGIQVPFIKIGAGYEITNSFGNKLIYNAYRSAGRVNSKIIIERS
jgi:hypothetical protein